MSGRITNWIDGKGYGFIETVGSDVDIFVHARNVASIDGAPPQGRVSLYRGDRVEFEVGPGRNGKSEAVNVRVTTK